MLVQLHLAANQRAEPFVDHAGVLRDSKTGRPINGARLDGGAYDEYEDSMRECLSLGCFPSRALRPRRLGRARGGTAGCDVMAALWLTRACLAAAGYSFFDSGEVEMLGRKKNRPSFYNTGKIIPLAEY